MTVIVGNALANSLSPHRTLAGSRPNCEDATVSAEKGVPMNSTGTDQYDALARIAKVRQLVEATLSSRSELMDELELLSQQSISYSYTEELYHLREDFPGMVTWRQALDTVLFYIECSVKERASRGKA